MFVGDVSLSRGVTPALDRDPWGAFPTGDAWIGNLEGTLAEGTCRKDPRYCLGIEPGDLDRLDVSPFIALSQANNHALDFGDTSMSHTDARLEALGIAALGPAVRRLTWNGRDLAFVAVDLSEGDTQPRVEAARLAVQKARAWTPWVVVLPHWGKEGMSELAPGQEAVAEVLHTWGAWLVVGSGAHAVQPSVCGDASATWYGLGNFLFDQRPPESREGLRVRCRPDGAGWRCTEEHVRRSEDSVLPMPAGEGESCTLRGVAMPDRSWEVHPWRDRFVSIQAFPAAGEGAWLGLHEAWSDLDGEVGLRPYVFRIEGDRFVDVWRGSSLARPMVAARLFEVGGDTRLCVIHRDDSFLAPDPDTRGRVRMVYRWNGFGFREVEEPTAMAVCERM